MKRLFLVAMMAMVAACGSTSPAATTTVDAASTAADTGASATDTGTGADAVSTDTGPVDAGTKDAAKEVAAPPAPTWGECAESDQACWQDCLGNSCSDTLDACKGDKKCMKFITCVQGCAATKPVMPAQDATPVVQLADENTLTYCNRVCTIQGGPTVAVMNNDLNECVIGRCFDCTEVKSLSSTQCKQICGKVNQCEDETAACAADADCVLTLGCAILCNGEPECSKGCQDKAPPAALKSLMDLDTCAKANAKACVAP